MDWPPYQGVWKLYDIAASYWAQIDASYYQIDLIREPPHRFLNLVFAWYYERLGEEDRKQFLAELEPPLAETKPAKLEDMSEAEREEEGALFMNMMNQPG